MLVREIARIVLASVLHKLKTVKGADKITGSRFAAWASGDGAVIAKLRYGAEAVVFSNEYIGRSMYLWGECDPRINSVIKAVLRRGDTALDLGANFGIIGLFAAKCVGPAGRVHLFEPQPLVASCLRTSLLINGFSHAVVHECALSDRSGSAIMTVLDATNMGMTTLSSSKSNPLDTSSAISVRTENAGEYVASLKCTKVAVIKIDVEGHEAVILASMREWLAEMRPPVILFECHLDGQTFHKHETVRILSGLGYDFFWIDKKPLWHTHLCPVEEGQRPVGYDFVAVLWQELDQDRRGALEALLD